MFLTKFKVYNSNPFECRYFGHLHAWLYNCLCHILNRLYIALCFSHNHLHLHHMENLWYSNANQFSWDHIGELLKLSIKANISILLFEQLQ